MNRSIATRLTMVLIAALALALTWVAWKPRSEVKKMDVGQVSSDVSTLSRLVKLPVAPRSVRWQVLEPGNSGTGPGPGDWALVAVMELDDGQGSQLASASTARAAAPRLLDQRLEPMIEAELARQISGVLEGPRAPVWRNGEPFFRQPLLSGFFVLSADARRLVLVLTTA
jgi:hypothetical protein